MDKMDLSLMAGTWVSSFHSGVCFVTSNRYNKGTTHMRQLVGQRHAFGPGHLNVSAGELRDKRTCATYADGTP